MSWVEDSSSLGLRSLVPGLFGLQKSQVSRTRGLTRLDTLYSMIALGNSGCYCEVFRALLYSGVGSQVARPRAKIVIVAAVVVIIAATNGDHSGDSGSGGRNSNSSSSSGGSEVAVVVVATGSGSARGNSSNSSSSGSRARPRARRPPKKN